MSLRGSQLEWCETAHGVKIAVPDYAHTSDRIALTFRQRQLRVRSGEILLLQEYLRAVLAGEIKHGSAAHGVTDTKILRKVLTACVDPEARPIAMGFSCKHLSQSIPALCTFYFIQPTACVLRFFTRILSNSEDGCSTALLACTRSASRPRSNGSLSPPSSPGRRRMTAVAGEVPTIDREGFQAALLLDGWFTIGVCSREMFYSCDNRRN